MNKDISACRSCCNHNVNLNSEIRCIFHLTLAVQLFNAVAVAHFCRKHGGLWRENEFMQILTNSSV